jgi:hypothetical protein
MSGRRSKVKGARGELELRDLFRQYGYTAERGGGAQGDGGSAQRPDVVHNLPGYHVECKRVEAYSVVNRGYKQAKKDAGAKLEPVMFARANWEEWLVTISAEHFFSLQLMRPL